MARLRTAIGDPPARRRIWTPRVFLWAAALILMALSVGWWVYSHTSDQDFYLRAEKLWRSAHYTEAVVLYEQLFLRSPQTELAEDALFDAATICYYHLSDVDRAVRLYKRLIATYPDSRHVPEACIRLGQIYESHLKDWPQAIRMWEEGIKVRPRARMVMSTDQYLGVLSKIADGYFNLNEFDQALAVYQRIVDDYPGSHNADQANVKIGIILQMQRLYRLSIRSLQTTIQATRCTDCRFMAQTALIEAYENLEDLDAALNVVDALTPPPGQEDYPSKERKRLRSKQTRLSARVKAPRRRR